MAVGGVNDRAGQEGDLRFGEEAAAQQCNAGDKCFHKGPSTMQDGLSEDSRNGGGCQMKRRERIPTSSNARPHWCGAQDGSPIQFSR